VLANAFFVSVEFALVAVDRSSVELAIEQGDRRARLVDEQLRRLNFYLSGAQVGITVSSLALGFIAQPAIARLLEEPLASLLGTTAVEGLALVIALAIATGVQMVVGELVPKAIAVARPLGTAVTLAPTARAYALVSAPLVTMFVGTANAVVRSLGLEPIEELSTTRSRSELAHLIRTSAVEGTLDAGEVSLLTRALRFGDKTAADVLTPRPDVRYLESASTTADLLEIAAATGHSRFPVAAQDLDDVIGVAHVKAIFDLPVAERSRTPITEVMAEPFVIPESRQVGPLLLDLRDTSNYLAVVLDEYGGTAGILTLEDLLEELVGEIYDEHDLGRHDSMQLGTGVLLSGGSHADEVSDACGFEMPDGEYETLAGFMLDGLGRIPVVGDRLDHDGWRLQVVAMDRRRISTVLAQRLPAAPNRREERS
jgi:CBS domain containing-hemolysin-like protein